MCLLWLLRLGRDRQRAAILSSSFLVLGLLFVGLSQTWPGLLMGVLAILLFALLFIDFATRATKAAEERS